VQHVPLKISLSKPTRVGERQKLPDQMTFVAKGDYEIGVCWKLLNEMG
jgi:hypothetical protein